MVSSIRLIMLVGIFLCSLVLAFAQTRDELQQRYESTENGGYLVRPGVVMTVSFSKNNLAEEFRIQRQSSVKNGNSDFGSESMSVEMATEIVDEIIPVSERGKLIREITFSAGCSSTQTSQYELVSISYALKCSASGTNRVLFTTIQ